MQERLMCKNIVDIFSDPSCDLTGKVYITWNHSWVQRIITLDVENGFLSRTRQTLNITSEKNYWKDGSIINLLTLFGGWCFSPEASHHLEAKAYVKKSNTASKKYKSVSTVWLDAKFESAWSARIRSAIMTNAKCRMISREKVVS